MIIKTHQRLVSKPYRDYNNPLFIIKILREECFTVPPPFIHLTEQPCCWIKAKQSRLKSSGEADRLKSPWHKRNFLKAINNMFFSRETCVPKKKKRLVDTDGEKRHTSTPPANWNNTLSVLHMRAAYITVMNYVTPPLLIFKCFYLWGKYNWAFICFVPLLWGIDVLWREFGGSETKGLQRRAHIFPPHCSCGSRVQAGSLRLTLKQKEFHPVTGSKNVTSCFTFFFKCSKVSQKKILQQGKRAEVCWLCDSCHEALSAVVKPCIFW